VHKNTPKISGKPRKIKKSTAAACRYDQRAPHKERSAQKNSLNMTLKLNKGNGKYLSKDIVHIEYIKISDSVIRPDEALIIA